MDGGTLPGVDDEGDGGDVSDRVVFHVDMDCFYASCERLREPELRGEPVVVGMGYEPGEEIGAVATASYEARAFGVGSAMPISEALDAMGRRVDADATDPEAPDPAETGYYRPVDLDYYSEVASTVKSVLHDCADVVREVSIDEAYLDVTARTAWSVVDDVDGDDDRDGDNDDDCDIDGDDDRDGDNDDDRDVDGDDDRDGDGNGDSDGDGDSDGAGNRSPEPSAAAGPATARTLAEGYARHVKQRIEREAGVPASVGVAPNMSTAKVASDFDKPNGLVVVPPGTVESFLSPLPTAELHGVGPVTEAALEGLGIETAGDVAAADPELLEAEFGERGRELYARARGEDDREVTPRGLPKSLSRESSLPATADEERKRDVVAALASAVAGRARERGCLYRTIGIKVVVPPYDVNTRARSLPGPVDDPALVERVALGLLEEFEGDRARKLGVRVSNLDFEEGDQSTLEGFEDDRTGPAVGTRRVRDEGEKLIDWVGRGSGSADARDDGQEGTVDGDGSTVAGTAETNGSDGAKSLAKRSTRRRTDDGQSSLGEWS